MGRARRTTASECTKQEMGGGDSATRADTAKMMGVWMVDLDAGRWALDGCRAAGRNWISRRKRGFSPQFSGFLYHQFTT